MKRFFFILSLVIGLSGCSQDAIELPIVEDKPEDSDFRMSPSDAIAAVEMFLDTEVNRTRSGSMKRKVAGVIDLKQTPQSRSTTLSSEVANRFYIVPFEGDAGYAVVSKDVRTFPVYAVLDEGSFSRNTLDDPNMAARFQTMSIAHRLEITEVTNQLAEGVSTSISTSNTSTSSPAMAAYYDLLKNGWALKRVAPPKLDNIFWDQKVIAPSIVLKKEGATELELTRIDDRDARSTLHKSEVKKFGCTTVAYTQVMYAMRNCPGFRDLKYTNGERVRWEKMSPVDNSAVEVQRFKGWFAANCSPIYWGAGTLIFNTNAKDFMRSIVGDYIDSRYDNCIFTEGDFDGYGSSEHKRLVEDFFANPLCFIIMSSASAVATIHYHTYVVDGMAEFNKNIYGSGFLGTGLFRKKRWATRTLYHINAGWGGDDNGYYLYVQDVNNEFKVTGTPDRFDYNCNTAYFVVKPK